MATWGCLPKWVIGAKLINFLWRVTCVFNFIDQRRVKKKKKILWTNAEFIAMFIEFLQKEQSQINEKTSEQWS